MLLLRGESRRPLSRERGALDGEMRGGAVIEGVEMPLSPQLRSSPLFGRSNRLCREPPPTDVDVGGGYRGLLSAPPPDFCCRE